MKITATELIAYANALSLLVSNVLTLAGKVHSGQIKPEDIDPASLRAPTAEEVEQAVREGRL